MVDVRKGAADPKWYPYPVQRGEELAQAYITRPPYLLRARENSLKACLECLLAGTTPICDA
jgi:hypothetical protein